MTVRVVARARVRVRVVARARVRVRVVARVIVRMVMVMRGESRGNSQGIKGEYEVVCVCVSVRPTCTSHRHLEGTPH